MEDSYLENIRSFVPRNYQCQTTSIWHRLPVARRAAVFVLLFLGQYGELRVVLTKRSSRLRSFPGHISLPGGMADSGLELPWCALRREMSEEIGISEHNPALAQYGFSVDPVGELPCYLLRTFSAVRPCIGFMKVSAAELLPQLKLRVNPGESSSIFLCPLRDFLFPAMDEIPREALERTHYLVRWGGIPWHLRSYTFRQANDNEVPWLQGFDDVSASESEADEANSPDAVEKRAQTPPVGRDCDHTKTRKRKKLSEWGKLGARRDLETNERIYDVWGLTANILHDLAEVMYLGGAKNGRELGDEELIWSFWHHGKQMRQRKRSSEESRLILLTPADNVSFGEVLPQEEFNRLRRLYKI